MDEHTMGRRPSSRWRSGSASRARDRCGARTPQPRQEVAPCRVQRGDRHVHEEGSAAVGRTTLGACARAIRAGSGTGTWGPYEVEVDADGRVRVDGEEVGVLHGPPDDAPAEGATPRAGLSARPRRSAALARDLPVGADEQGAALVLPLDGHLVVRSGLLVHLGHVQHGG